MKQRLVRIDQSPMNALIWVLQLACGHDVYVTQTSRPSLTRTWTDKQSREPDGRAAVDRMSEMQGCADTGEGEAAPMSTHMEIMDVYRRELYPIWRMRRGYVPFAQWEDWRERGDRNAGFEFIRTPQTTACRNDTSSAEGRAAKAWLDERRKRRSGERNRNTWMQYRHLMRTSQTGIGYRFVSVNQTRRKVRLRAVESLRLSEDR